MEIVVSVFGVVGITTAMLAVLWGVKTLCRKMIHDTYRKDNQKKQGEIQ